MLVVATPMLLFMGKRQDAYGALGFLAITALGFLCSRRSRLLGTRVHLVLLYPLWIWYAAMPDSLFTRLDAGVAEYVVMLVFPVLVSVTMDGFAGAIASGALGGAGIVYLFEQTPERLEGVFFFSALVMIGLMFRRLATELDRTQARLRHMAFHDALTTLANRRQLMHHAESWLYDNGSGALLFVDLDRFKTVNDVLGHTIGDEVLRGIAERLRDVVSERHLVARIGGDEFAALLRDVDESEAIELANQMVYRLTEPFDAGGRAVHVGATVGIAMWPQHGGDLEALMRSADLAMYRAKKRGDQVAVHTDDEDLLQLSSRGLEVDMQKAIEDGELVLQFQPVVRVVDNNAVGAETLVRWQHPQHGLLSPASFIALAEETGHIQAIDRWVLRQALAQLQRWDTDGWGGFVAVNLSARTLHETGLAAEVERLLAATGVAPERLVLELTESAAMIDPDQSLARLRELSELGVTIAIDDFGMGYSSLAYLKRFPASHVKIDRSFTNGIGVHPRDEEVIELVLQLADKWGLDVIAEGVENEAQLEWLEQHGCSLVQGYFLGRPAVPDGVPASQRRPAAA